MDIKIVIVLLLIGVIASLFSGLVFLFKDSDKDGSKRTLYALGVRIGLAGLLVATISYGIYSGQLGMNAPWHQSIHASDTQDSLPSAPN